MSRFTNDGFCRECGQHRDTHQVYMETGLRGLSFMVFGCVDPTLPDPNRDDDPWAPSAHEPEPPIARLFDPVCV